MKTFVLKHAANRRNDRGIALVITLLLLVLLSAFAVAFFTRMSVEQVSATSYADGVSTRQLAESTVAAVEAQIREATTALPNGAWATQPGMVRVFGTPSSASSDLYASYKLYSSDSMTVSGVYDETKEIDQDWASKPAMWTDLNEPVAVRKKDRDNKEVVVERYPVMDPTVAAKIGDGQDPFKTSADQLVEGYAITSRDETSKRNPEARMPVRWLYILRDGAMTAPDSVSSDGKTVEWKGSGRNIPSKENPIVGRTAFWTDDETSKVNINTSGGFTTKDAAKNGYTEDNYAGSFWDTPRFFTQFERGGPLGDDSNDGMWKNGGGSLALSQPPNKEYQRYPGHPFTTSLGLVFSPPGQTPRIGSEQLYRLLPNMVTGGSRSGTDRLLSLNDDSLNLDIDPNKSKRLYPSVDEFFFAAQRPSTVRKSANEDLKTAYAPDPKVEPMTSDLVQPGELEAYRFFLTAHSRSPELNLFGRPRISMWPNWPATGSDSQGKTYASKRNSVDNLMAFCSTLGPLSGASTLRKEFYFQRSNPYSPSADVNITRNQALLTYLAELTDKPFPGSTGSFKQKYASGGRDDRAQILMEMFDYIRCANLRDTTRVKPLSLPAGVAREAYMYAPRGIVVPAESAIRTSSGSTQAAGFGRFPIISEVALVFYHAGYLPNDPAQPAYYDPRDKQTKGVRANLMRFAVIVETFNPMQGYSTINTFNGNDQAAGNVISHRIKWNTGMGANVGNPRKGVQQFAFDRNPQKNIIKVSSGDRWAGRNFGGMEGVMHTLGQKYGGGLFANRPQAQVYPFQDLGPGVEVPFNPITAFSDPNNPNPQLNPYGTFDFSDGNGGDVTADLQLLFGDRPLQQIRLRFPKATLPVPTDAYWQDPGGFAWDNKVNGANFGAGSNWASTTVGDLRFMKCFADRIYWTDNNGESVHRGGSYAPWSNLPPTNGDGNNYDKRYRNILQPGDTVRSLVPKPATTTDIRTIALSRDWLDDQVYAPLPDYFDKTLRNVQPNPSATTPPSSFVPAVTQTLRFSGGEPYFRTSVGGTSQYSVEPSIIVGGGGNVSYGWVRRDYTPKFGNLVAIGTAGAYGNVAADLPAKSPGVSGYVDGIEQGANNGHNKGPGDFDSGVGNYPDGGYCNKPDEGNFAWRYFDSAQNKNIYVYPYFTDKFEESYDTFFSANRQMPSPVMFGSLITGKKSDWETLCFSPNPANKNHYGLQAPRDHLLLDLFTMPVVEPYAISEPFSTAGKININTKIVPFSYIHRTTALRAALHSVRVTAVPKTDVSTYKVGSGGQNLTKNYRYVLNRDETVKGIVNGPKDGLYRSASEICDRFLYPKNTGGTDPKWSQSEAEIRAFWYDSKSGRTLGGDNTREKPYADLYPRLTTKSNTFTVHMRVQKLRPQSKNYTKFTESEDSIAAEYRGEAEIERYLDPNDRRFDSSNSDTNKFKDYVDVTKVSLEQVYRFRVINSKRFAPAF